MHALTFTSKSDILWYSHFFINQHVKISFYIDKLAIIWFVVFSIQMCNRYVWLCSYINDCQLVRNWLFTPVASKWLTLQYEYVSAVNTTCSKATVMTLTLYGYLLIFSQNWWSPYMHPCMSINHTCFMEQITIIANYVGGI